MLCCCCWGLRGCTFHLVWFTLVRFLLPLFGCVSYCLSSSSTIHFFFDNPFLGLAAWCLEWLRSFGEKGGLNGCSISR